ncbi:MAG: ribokinase [Rhodobacteraceae bacterium]|nr:ribokinase [Paracoccaceae bacterium]
MMYVERIPDIGETLLAKGYEEHPGGKGANQAVSAALWGQPVNFLGRIGSDEPGKILRSAMEKAGVNTDYLLEGSTPSGMAMDFIDLEGNYQAVVLAGSNADLDGVDLPMDNALWKSIGLTVLQLECPLSFNETVGLESKKSGIPVLLNAAPIQNIPDTWWNWIEILVVNEVEAESLSGVKIMGLKEAYYCLEKLMEQLDQVIITLGSEGLVFGNGSERAHIPGHAVPVVSTLGAGDAFVGVLAAELCRGHDLHESALIANFAAAASVTKTGAQNSYITPDKLKHHPLLGDLYNKVYLGV